LGREASAWLIFVDSAFLSGRGERGSAVEGHELKEATASKERGGAILSLEEVRGGCLIQSIQKERQWKSSGAERKEKKGVEPQGTNRCELSLKGKWGATAQTSQPERFQRIHRENFEQSIMSWMPCRQPKGLHWHTPNTQRGTREDSFLVPKRGATNATVCHHQRREIAWRKSPKQEKSALRTIKKSSGARSYLATSERPG